MPKSFEKTVNRLVTSGFTKIEAEIQVHTRVDQYLDNNAAGLQSAAQQSNENGRVRTAQLITLAILLITVTGIFIAQQDIYKMLTWRHQWLILLIVAMSLASITIGVVEYFKNEKLFNDWHNGHLRVHEVVVKGVNDGAFETIDDMHAAGRAITGRLKPSTGMTIPILQLVTALFAGFCFMVLLMTVMFDVPGIQ